MATRLYLTNADPEITVTPSRDPVVTVPGMPVRHLGLEKDGAYTTISHFGVNERCLGLWVSPPLAEAVTITSVSAVLAFNSGGVGDLDLRVWATQGDSDTARGVFVSEVSGQSISSGMRGYAAVTPISASVALQVGDRIVLDAMAFSTITGTVTFGYGGTGAADLTSGSTTVTTSPSWIQFSPDLNFAATGDNGGFFF